MIKNQKTSYQHTGYWIINPVGRDICSNCLMNSRPEFKINNKVVDNFCPYCGSFNPFNELNNKEIE